MAKNIFIRNTRAAEQLELFLLSAISSVLLVRFYLYLADYPQIGGGGLHIAHMLWGGLLMLIANILLFTYIGRRVQRISAVIGGVGFGVFIDELGKFITRDNDYFFQPTIALIYATFIILYLTFRFITQTRTLTNKAYLLNALVQLEDVVLDDFEESEKRRVEGLLAKADSNDSFKRLLQQGVAAADVKSDAVKKLEFIGRFRSWIDIRYAGLLQKRYTSRAVKIFFIIEAILFLSTITFLIINSFYEVLSGNFGALFELELYLVGEAISAAVAGLFVLWGLYKFSSSRMAAYELFLQAILVQIFLTNFFIFYREQFGALPIFLFNVILFVLLRAIIQSEQRIVASKADI